MTKESPYILVLTHDVDLLSVRELPWHSRTLWGFAVRAIFGNLARVLGRQITVGQYLFSLGSGLSMPLIKLGLLRDPIEQSFKTMLDIERKHGVRSTLYFIAEARRPGLAPDGRKAPSARAAHYDIETLAKTLRGLEQKGWEIGVHGIDAYRSPDAARREFLAVSQILGHKRIGHRSHWLYSMGRHTWNVLRDAGFDYDASYGWNYRVGWPGGRRSPFHPLSEGRFVVLPLNIQDGALLEPAMTRLGMRKAWGQVRALLRQASESAGVITVLWHTHSFCEPRDWGGLYEKIILQAKADGAGIVPAKRAIASWRNSRETKE